MSISAVTDAIETFVENADPSEAFFGKMTWLDKLTFLPTLTVFILMMFMIGDRGRHNATIDRLEDLLGADGYNTGRPPTPWRTQINQTDPFTLHDINDMEDVAKWTGQVFLPKIATYAVAKPQKPLPDYTDEAKKMFSKSEGKAAVRLVNGGVRLGPISIRQLRTPLDSFGDLDPEPFDFRLPVQGSHLTTHKTTYTPDVEYVQTADGYFGSYPSGGFFAMDPCTSLSGGPMMPNCPCQHGLELPDCVRMNEVQVDASMILPYFAVSNPPGCNISGVASRADPCPLWLNASTTLAIVINFLVMAPHIEEKEALITSCEIIFEHAEEGKIYPSLSCTNPGDIPFMYDIWVIVVVCLYAMFEVCNLAQQKSQYFTSPWKWIDIIQLGLLVVYLVMRAAISEVLHSELYDDDNSIVDIPTVLKVASLSSLSQTMFCVFGIASLLNVIKILRYLGLFPLLALPCLTVTRAGWPLVSFFLMSIILQLAVTLMVSVVLAPYSLSFSTFGNSLNTVMFQMVAGPNHGIVIADLPPEYQWYGNLASAFFRFLMYFVMMPVVLAIICYSYVDTRSGFNLRETIDTTRIWRLLHYFQGRPCITWCRASAIAELQEKDQEYIAQKDHEEAMKQMASVENKCQAMALDLIGVTKGLEHMAVRMAAFSTLDFQVSAFVKDFKVTQTEVLGALVATSQHLDEVIANGREQKKHAKYSSTGHVPRM